MSWKQHKIQPASTVITPILVLVFFCLVFSADGAWSRDAEQNGGVTDDTATMRAEPPDSVVAYYFHRTYRCVRCITMEAYVLAVLHLKHSAELETGALRWHAIDYEDPDNSHYAEKHDFDGPALVLSHWKDGVETHWADLREIWALMDDPGILVGWIDRNVEACLRGKCDHGSTEEG